MTKRDVQIGQTYYARIGDDVVPVRIEGENRYGGWDARNEKSGRPVRIKSAAKLTTTHAERITKWLAAR